MQGQDGCKIAQCVITAFPVRNARKTSMTTQRITVRRIGYTKLTTDSRGAEPTRRNPGSEVRMKFSELTERERGYNEGLCWAADWLLSQAEANNDVIKGFAKNISDSIRAQKKPWGVDHSPSACNICGVECDGWKDGIQPVCPECCDDHDFEYVREDRQHECKYCFQIASPEYFD